MFIAYVKQGSQGCDYSIGCGQALWRLEAETYDEAVEEVKRGVIGKWLPEYASYEEGHWDEYWLKRVTLFETIMEEDMSLEVWYTDAQTYKIMQKSKNEENKEKAEYMRLKEKFG